MTAILRRRPDIGRHLVTQMGLDRPIVDLIYISFIGSVASHVAGGGFSNKPLENLATLLLVLGLYTARLIILAPSIRILLAKPTPFQFFFVMQFLLIPMRLILGFWNKEPHVYVATDFLLAVSNILVYVVSRASYEQILPLSDAESFRGLFLTISTMLFVGAFPVTIAKAGVVVTIMGAVMVFLYASSKKPMWQSAVGFAILVFCLLSVPRAFLLGIGTAVVLIGLANIFWRTLAIGLSVAVSLAVLVVLNFETIPNLPPRVVQLGKIAQAAEQVDWSKVTFTEVLALADVAPSIHERVWEAQQVVIELNKQGTFAWIFGMGYGTSLDFSNAPDPTVANAAKAGGLAGGGLVHNVHLIIFEQLLRFGLLGLAIFLWIFWKMLIVYWRCRKVVMRTGKVTFDFMCILTVIGSYVYFQFASDWDIAYVAFGMLGYLDARFELTHQALQKREQLSDLPDWDGDFVPEPA